MVQVQQSLVLTASADDVWALVGNFDKIKEWHPAVLAIELDDIDEGHVRILALLGGTKKMVEKLLESDDEEMRYSYETLDGPLPVQNFVGHISVDASMDEDGGSIFTWFAEFDARDTTDEDAEAVIKGYFSTGLSGIKKAFTPPPS